MGRTQAVVAMALGWQVMLGAASSPHLRTDGREQQRLIDAASRQSATFQQLVARLQQSSVVVYVSFGICPGHVESCLTYVTSASGITYVRATLNQFYHSQAALAGLLAHELRHALEVADAGVTSLEGFWSFYDRHGRRWSAGYETDEAAAAGQRVERELAVYKTQR